MDDDESGFISMDEFCPRMSSGSQLNESTFTVTQFTRLSKSLYQTILVAGRIRMKPRAGLLPRGRNVRSMFSIDRTFMIFSKDFGALLLKDEKNEDRPTDMWKMVSGAYCLIANICSRAELQRLCVLWRADGRTRGSAANVSTRFGESTFGAIH